MRIPTTLKEDEAKAFWKRHVNECIKNGSLTEETVDAFTLLCRLWHYIATTDPHQDSRAAMKFNGLIKHFQTFAKPFGLMGSKPPTKPVKQIGDIIKDALESQEGYTEPDAEEQAE